MKIFKFILVIASICSFSLGIILLIDCINADGFLESLKEVFGMEIDVLKKTMLIRYITAILFLYAMGFICLFMVFVVNEKIQLENSVQEIDEDLNELISKVDRIKY